MCELTIEIGEVKFLDDILADVADKMHEVVSFPMPTVLIMANFRFRPSRHCV